MPTALAASRVAYAAFDGREDGSRGQSSAWTPRRPPAGVHVPLVLTTKGMERRAKAPSAVGEARSSVSEVTTSEACCVA